MDYLLEDITVVDAATFVAGPAAATVLADFGANVIKIEPPGGDGYRGLVGRYPVPYHWQLTSRNKRSVAVDVSTDAGQQVMHRLVEKADVFTTNFNERQLAKFRLGYEELSALNPRLVYAHISGYGLRGPEKDRRAFDVTAWWARSGLMEFIRDPGQKPLSAAPGMGDHSTASAFFGAIMLGLYRREKTGKGSFVSTSLAANGVWANGMALQGVIAGNDAGKYRQEKGWGNPFTGIYRCADDRYLVLSMINTKREYPQLCEALGSTHWLKDERFTDARQVLRNRDDFRAEMDRVIAQWPYGKVAARLDKAGITYGPIQAMADVINDPQLRANDVILETGDPGEDYQHTINTPISIDGEAKRPPKRAPDVGADTAAVLSEIGFSSEETQALIRSGAVHQASGE